MKRGISRLLATFVVMFVVIAFTASAEDFTLRNGIMFGDTMDEVLAKETLSVESRDESTITTVAGNVATIDNSYLIYSFHADGTLYDEFINFGVHIGKTEQADAAYSAVYDTLCRKYGDPFISDDGSLYGIVGSAVYKVAEQFQFLESVGIQTSLQAISQWIVRCENYNVKIDLLKYGPNGPKSSDVVLSYRMFTDAEEEAIINEKCVEQAQMDSDL